MGWICRRCGVENPIMMRRCRACGKLVTIGGQILDIVQRGNEGVLDLVEAICERHPGIDAAFFRRKALRGIRVVATVSAVACLGICVYSGIAQSAGLAAAAAKLARGVNSACALSADNARTRGQVFSRAVDDGFDPSPTRIQRIAHSINRRHINRVDAINWRVRVASENMALKKTRYDNGMDAALTEARSVYLWRSKLLMRRLRHLRIEDFRPDRLWGGI